MHSNAADNSKRDQLIVSGCIDSHVHFRDGIQSYKETIIHGLAVAESQGVDIVFDMPNSAPPVFDETSVNQRIMLLPFTLHHRYFTFIGATADKKQIQTAVKLVNTHPFVIGIKLYAGHSTGNLGVNTLDAQLLVYQTLKEENYQGVLTVHCEKESEMNNNLFDYNNPISHCIARPENAEIESVKDQISYVKKTGFKGILHIAHISTKGAVEEVIKAQKEGINIVCGVCPHHLLWDESKMNSSEGLLYKMNPPLRKKADVEYLIHALKEGTIDWIETDHAPHAIGEKLHGGKNSPSGYPSLYIYQDCLRMLHNNGFSLDLLKRITRDNILKSFPVLQKQELKKSGDWSL